MTFFFTDADLVGAGETAEAEVWLATKFTVPAGIVASYRWPFPVVASGVTPKIRVYDASDVLVDGPLSFNTSTDDAWNSATPTVTSLAAGTYRATVNTTRYKFVGGFFAGGSITRGSVTAVSGMFGSPGSAPGSSSTAWYGPDIDFTASGGGTTPFTKDVAEVYRILNAFTKDSAETYRILNAFQGNVAEVYRVLNTWNVDSVERYRLFAAWVKTSVERYQILSDTVPVALPVNVWADLSPQYVVANLDSVQP